MLGDEIKAKLEKMRDEIEKVVNQSVLEFYNETGIVPQLQLHNATMMGDDKALETRYRIYTEVTIYPEGR